MNEGTDGRTGVFSGQLSQLAPIPVVGVSYELGCSLDIAARGGATVRLEVNAVIGKRLTRNVLADTAFNSDSSFIIVGAHLDSVPEGPGAASPISRVLPSKDPDPRDLRTDGRSP